MREVSASRREAIMKPSNFRHGAAAAAVCALVLFGFASLPSTAQTLGSPERFTASAVDLQRGGSARVEIVVERWSTEAERSKLLGALFEGGQDALLDTLRSAPKAGYIRDVNSIGWDLHYAQHTPLPDGGERVIVATDRPLSYWEQSNRARTVDYPFTIVQLNIGKGGEGDGTMAAAAKISGDKETKTIVIENFGIQPVQLMGVQKERD
jgi:hypothetical protein